MTGLPEALLDPAAFPAAPLEVELRETLISWVFLAGDRAYKVKKPVALPFLDYGTPKRRLAFCEEEVRVNRRLAPDVYLGVVALVPRPGGGLRVAPRGTAGAVEHAVEMRRFAETDTLAHALTTGGPGDARLEAIGERLARFHATAEPVDGDAATAGLAGVVDETLATLAGCEPPDLEELDRFTRAALRAVDGELRERAARGLARDGHGDLRAEHVLLTDPPSVVDALEFDPGLRGADVAYDLAFLVMDLSRADPRLADPLLRGYRAAGGDPGSRRLQAFLVVLRALVRAKVNLLRAGQLTGAAAAERRERALGLLTLARRTAWAFRLPPVVAVGGLSGSGKSTVANALAEATGREVLRSDVVRKRLAGVDPGRRAATAVYAPEAGAAVYRALGSAAAEHAENGVIVDATFRRAADVASFTAACPAEHGWIECRAPAAVLLERARRRGGVPEHGSDAGEAVVREQLAETGGVLPLPQPPLAVLDTTRPVAELLDGLAAGMDRVSHRCGDDREGLRSDS